MEFEGTSQEKQRYGCKFVRVGKRFFVTAPDDFGTQHEALARTDGILEELKELRRLDPTAVDGGVLYVNSPKKEIIAYDSSFGLRLPAKDQARTLTVALLQSKFPEYQVDARRQL